MTRASFTRISALGVVLSVAGCGGPDGDAPAVPAASGGGGSAAGGSGGGGATGGGGSATGGDASVSLPPAAACPAASTPCGPTVLDSGIPSPGTFQVRDGYLYWRNTAAAESGTNRDANSVLRVRLPDGAPEVVTTLDGGSLMSIAVDATHVYLADHQRGVARVPVGGGTPEYLTDAGAVVVTLDETHVYFSLAQSNGAVARVPKAGGAVQNLALATSPTHVAVDATHLYWVDRAGSPLALSRVPKAGGDAEILVSDVPERPERVIVIGDELFLPVDRPEGTTGARGAILRVPAAGGAVQEITSHAHPFGSMGVDADSFYVGTCPGVAGEAAVLRIPRAGGSGIEIARGGLCYVGVTVDATRVYFGEWGAPNYQSTGDGSVLSADKCGCP